jgi:hypothetical protein
MTRAAVVSLFVLSLAAPANADVTIKQSTSGKGLGMSGTTSGTIYIKGAKMRADDLFAVPGGYKLKERR